MYNIGIKKENIVSNYNLIASSIILARKGNFTYDDILKEVETVVGCMPNELITTIKKAMIRLRDDDFLTILGSKYSVKNTNNL